jgi:predicted Fe-Mo cluster-binding NifX family protein
MDSPIDPRFGRCAYFIIVDTDTMQHNAIENDAAMASGGAGIRAAQTVASTNVEAVITGSVGPNAHPALQSAGIKIMTGAVGTVREAVQKMKQGQLQQISTPGPAHRGMGMGRGRGMGGGRGQGRGRRNM